MISKVSIRNYKCLRDVTADLERFTVFVGPNASGKSSILQALDYLCRMFRIDHPQNNDGGLQQSLSRGATDQIELAAESGGKAYRYCTRSPSSPVTPHVDQAKWTGVGRGVATTFAASDWKQWKPVPPGSTPLPLSVLLRLESSKLVQPNPSSDPTNMAADGSGLHTALASMALNEPDSWQALQANLRRIIPTIRRLRHTKTANMHQPAALLFDTVGADSVPANQVSEGTLLVLGLLAALHASDRPNLVLLDDLDRGLHPRAQKELITLLRGLLDTNADLQIVATTHSPYMLDCVGVNEVRMTFLKDDGATVCAALTSHPNYPKWRGEMAPGEMWSLFGEKWVAEEVPA
jgi:predicted ATPase